MMHLTLNDDRNGFIYVGQLLECFNKIDNKNDETVYSLFENHFHKSTSSQHIEETFRKKKNGSTFRLLDRLHYNCFLYDSIRICFLFIWSVFSYLKNCVKSFLFVPFKRGNLI